MLKSKVVTALSKEIEPNLILDLVNFFEELKASYTIGDYEKTILKGGKFIEVVARILQFRINEPITLSGEEINIDNLVETARNSLKKSNPDSIRLLIPRFLRPLYDIRNNRGAHYSPVNPNSIDAAILEMGCSWIMAEFIRLFVTDDIDDTKILINGLVSKRVPLVEEWDQFLTVLDPRIMVPDQILLLLYKKHPTSVSADELKTWVIAKNQNTVTTALRRLVKDRRFVLHSVDYKLSASGHKYIESKYQKGSFDR